MSTLVPLSSSDFLVSGSSGRSVPGPRGAPDVVERGTPDISVREAVESVREALLNLVGDYDDTIGDHIYDDTEDGVLSTDRSAVVSVTLSDEDDVSRVPSPDPSTDQFCGRSADDSQEAAHLLAQLSQSRFGERPEGAEDGHCGICLEDFIEGDVLYRYLGGGSPHVKRSNTSCLCQIVEGPS